MEDNPQDTFVNNHALIIGIILWVAAVICLIIGCLLFTIDINASYWQVLQKNSYMPYAFLGIPLIILGLTLSVIVALLWYYAD